MISDLQSTGEREYLAERAGRACCICLPEAACDILTLSALSPEQCAACDTLQPERDVYYTALLDMGDELYLLTPQLLKACGEWTAFAEWLREEMTYESETCDVRCVGKTDFLRYMSERVMMWKEDGQWARSSFSVGTVLYEGERRPAMASHCCGAVNSVAIFDDSHGMVGHIHTLPVELAVGYEVENMCLPEGTNKV